MYGEYHLRGLKGSHEKILIDSTRTKYVILGSIKGHPT